MQTVKLKPRRSKRIFIVMMVICALVGSVIGYYMPALLTNFKEIVCQQESTGSLISVTQLHGGGSNSDRTSELVFLIAAVFITLIAAVVALIGVGNVREVMVMREEMIDKVREVERKILDTEKEIDSELETGRKSAEALTAKALSELNKAEQDIRITLKSAEDLSGNTRNELEKTENLLSNTAKSFNLLVSELNDKINRTGEQIVQAENLVNEFRRLRKYHKIASALIYLQPSMDLSTRLGAAQTLESLLDEGAYWQYFSNLYKDALLNDKDFKEKADSIEIENWNSLVGLLKKLGTDPHQQLSGANA